MSKEALASMPILSKGIILAKRMTRLDVIKSPSVSIFHCLFYIIFIK